MPAAIYPTDPWLIRETSFDPSLVARNETIFALGNGHLGMRGNFEEGRCIGVAGTYLNGFFEETPIIYGEIAYGYAKNRQVMLNIADAKIIRLFIDQEPLDLCAGRLLAYERYLDLREGVLVRTLAWESPGGRRVDLTVRRLVSFERRHAAAIEYCARAAGGALRIESVLDATVTNRAAGDDPRVGAHFRERPLVTISMEGKGRGAALVQQTRNTKLTVACVVDHAVEATGSWTEAMVTAAESSALRLESPGPDASSVRLVKYIGYCSSREFAGSEVQARAAEAVSGAMSAGFGELAAEQRRSLVDFWSRADVRIDGDESLQQGLRFNLFSLLQAAGRDGRTSVAAKGLSGEGYEGHYFWDTEIYMLPCFIYTSPGIARALA